MKVVIVGGSAGGASVAARLRRMNEHANITIYEESDTPSFATCGSPYYLGEVIKDRDRLSVVSLAEFSSILNVVVKTDSRVTAIDRARKRVVVFDVRRKSTYEDRYDALVLAPGSSAKRSCIEGDDLPFVFTLRNAADTDAIKEYIRLWYPRKAVVIGGGFIGVEVAENLSHIGIDVTIVDGSDQILNAWDREFANVAHDHLLAKGVKVQLNACVSEIDWLCVTLKSGRKIGAEIVVLALGVQPNNWLAKNCGLAIGEHGGISVNTSMRTSDEDIYALGDAVEIENRVSQKTLLNPLAGAAHKQARLIADNICGHNRRYNGTQQTAIVKVFDLTLAQTGCSEKALRKCGIEYKKSYIQAPVHAAFYPNAHNLFVKLLFHPETGRIFGAQVAGASGVDKRIDVLAAAIAFGKTVSELVELELAYAPPYSSAKDPVNIAAMVAENMLRGDCQVLHWDELDALAESDTLFIDVRTEEEFDLGSLRNAVNIPLNDIRNRLREIPRNKTIVLFCQYGKKGYFAQKILKQVGYENVFNLGGGRYVVNMGNRFLGEERCDATAQLHIPRNTASQVSKAPAAAPALESASPDQKNSTPTIEIDASGLTYPGPILQLSKIMKTANCGEIVKIKATDMGFPGDVRLWCERQGHMLLQLCNTDNGVTAMLRKGGAGQSRAPGGDQ